MTNLLQREILSSFLNIYRTQLWELYSEKLEPAEPSFQIVFTPFMWIKLIEFIFLKCIKYWLIEHAQAPK